MLGPVLFAGAGMALIVLIWLATERRMGQVRGGRFDVAGQAAEAFVFRSDYGIVEFPADGTTVIVGPRTIELAQVRSLGRATAEQHVGWRDELLGGLDFSDFSGRYRDRMIWHLVVLRLDTGEQVPLFAAGQVDRREMMQQGLLRATREWMQERGYVGNARLDAARVHARILARVPALRPK